MGNFKRINKTVVKFLKHLLNSASTDTARPLLQNIHVTDKYCCAANGWMLTFVQVEPESDIFKALGWKSGDYIINLGNINHEAIVELTEYMAENYPGQNLVEYPDLLKILHKNTEPVISFSVNPHLLRLLLKEADNSPVYFHVFSPTETLELQYTVDGRAVYSCIMPMQSGKKEEGWRPE